MKIGLFVKKDERAEAGKGEIRSILKKYKTDFASYEKLKNIDCDILVVLGDDSAILSAFMNIESEIPVLGVSMDGPHFLTEIEIRDFENYLKKILKNEYWMERRIRLNVEVDGKKLPMALNEIALCNTKTGGLLRYSLKIDNELVWRDSGDGVIVSTPTGSTGYGLSAGGPIIMENSGSIGIVPICSANMKKPLVVNETAVISLYDIFSTTGSEIIIDGRYRYKIKDGKVCIKKSEKCASFIRFDKRVYLGLFGKLREKTERLVLPKDAPPSAKFIYKLLEYEGSMTQKEIISESSLPARTVRHALTYLLDTGLMERHLTLRDTRQSVYTIKK